MHRLKLTFGSDVKDEKYTNLQKQYTTVKLQMHTCFIVARLSWKYFTKTLSVITCDMLKQLHEISSCLLVV